MPACGSLVATMLQISQTENPMCSATIDQIRLRRAMNLPLEFQNASFSGFQSEIQVGSLELISRFPCSNGVRAVTAALSPGMGSRSGNAFLRAFTVGTDDLFSTDGFDGV